MSRDGSITLEWGGEPERAFRLGIGQIKVLQEKIGAGPLGVAAMCQVTFAALSFQTRQDWLSLSQLNLSQLAEKTHVRETLRQGLLGAGAALPVVDKLIREYVDERPLDENLLVTIAVCNAHVYGVDEEEPAGEPEAVVEGSPLSTAADTGSGKTASTRSGRRAASPPPKSMQ